MYLISWYVADMAVGLGVVTFALQKEEAEVAVEEEDMVEGVGTITMVVVEEGLTTMCLNGGTSSRCCNISMDRT